MIRIPFFETIIVEMTLLHFILYLLLASALTGLVIAFTRKD